jgi:VIT1/CCC1 family predicted Fe2+/Mn2+ transporter
MACLAALPGQRSEYAGSPPRCSTRPRGLLPGCLTGYRKMVMMTSADDGPAPATRAHEGDRPRRAEAHAHHHRDVSGGWLRPAVFGAMDGLVTNVSLIAGVGGGGASQHAIVLTGLAGLAAGAFSMATGEYVSVSSQNELVQAEVLKEKHELEHNPDAERRELAAVFRGRGVDADLADRVARQVSDRPEDALRMHVREELGVDHHELPSPLVAGAASLATFAVGALIPLLPWLVGFGSLAATVIIAAVVAFIGGGIVSKITDRPFLRGALRQLLLAAAAAGLTYAIGRAVGATIH